MENLIGANWLWSGGQNWQMETSLSHMYTSYEDTYWETAEDSLLFQDNTSESSINLRNVTYYRFNSANRIKFGFEASRISNDYDSFTKAYRDQYGNVVSPLNIKRKISAVRLGGFLSLDLQPHRQVRA